MPVTPRIDRTKVREEDIRLVYEYIRAIWSDNPLNTTRRGGCEGLCATGVRTCKSPAFYLCFCTRHFNGLCNVLPAETFQKRLGLWCALRGLLAYLVFRDGTAAAMPRVFEIVDGVIRFTLGRALQAQPQVNEYEPPRSYYNTDNLTYTTTAHVEDITDNSPQRAVLSIDDITTSVSTLSVGDNQDSFKNETSQRAINNSDMWNSQTMSVSPTREEHTAENATTYEPYTTTTTTTTNNLSDIQSQSETSSPATSPRAHYSVDLSAEEMDLLAQFRKGRGG